MKKVVFLCVENSCRSQIAEAFANIHGKDEILAFSAGSKPSGTVNPKAVSLMKEINYDRDYKYVTNAIHLSYSVKRYHDTFQFRIMSTSCIPNPLLSSELEPSLRMITLSS